MNSFMVSRSESEHPTDDVLLALVHEQSFDDAAAIRGHVASCAVCSVRSRELAVHDAAIGALLESLDHPLTQAQSSFRDRNANRLRRAALVAGALATMAGAAAALVPASPLHQWIVNRSEPAPAVRAKTPATSPQATAPAAPTGEVALATGIAIPAPATLVIVFRREQPGGVVEIGHTAPGDVTFRTRGGNTAYDVAEGQVTIDNQTPADAYVIDVPATVRQVRIRVGSRTLLRWPEDSAKVASRDSTGRIHVDLHAPTAIP